MIDVPAQWSDLFRYNPNVMSLNERDPLARVVPGALLLLLSACPGPDEAPENAAGDAVASEMASEKLERKPEPRRGPTETASAGDPLLEGSPAAVPDVPDAPPVPWQPPEEVSVRKGPLEVTETLLDCRFPWDEGRRDSWEFDDEPGSATAHALSDGDLLIHLTPPGCWFERVHLLLRLSSHGPEGRQILDLCLWVDSDMIDMDSRGQRLFRFFEPCRGWMHVDGPPPGL